MAFRLRNPTRSYTVALTNDGMKDVPFLALTRRCTEFVPRFFQCVLRESERDLMIKGISVSVPRPTKFGAFAPPKHG